MDLCEEGIESSSDVITGVDRRAEKGEKHLFSYGVSGDISWGIGGKPLARRPILAAVSWMSETKWSRLPVGGEGKREAGVEFLRRPRSRCWWEDIG